jgi:hypothetical protein
LRERRVLLVYLFGPPALDKWRKGKEIGDTFEQEEAFREYLESFVRDEKTKGLERWNDIRGVCLRRFAKKKSFFSSSIRFSDGVFFSGTLNL